MNEQQLLDQLERLPRQRQPGVDLWPGIESRIASSRNRRFGWIPAAAAAALVGALVTVFGVSVYEPTGTEPMVEQSRVIGPGLVYASGVDLEYSGALRDLSGQMRAWSVESQDQAAVQAGLLVLTQASDDLRAAIAENPESIYLAQLLESTQRKQLAVMRDLLMQRSTDAADDAEQLRT